MTRYLKTAFAAAAALLAASCISNDIPYPVVELRIANVEGEGFSVSENNVTSRVVTLTLDEATDIRNVKIDAVTYDAVVHSIELNKAELLDQVRSSQELTGTFNLLSPIYTTLSLYQDYDWTIRAVQTIERRFSVTGQIGATEIDTDFNVNVITDSNGRVISGAGGHGDTAEGAKMTVITAPLYRNKYPTIVDHVSTVTTPGRFVDLFVCQEGIAVNTALSRNVELASRLKDEGIPVWDMHDLQKRAEQFTGKLPPLSKGKKIVGDVYWRDGSVIDHIFSMDECV